MEIIKRHGPKLKDRKGKIGGNRKPQSFKICPICEKEFGPLVTLKTIYCSMECKHIGMVKKETKIRKCHNYVRAAQRRVSYEIEMGRLKRPTKCPKCGKEGKIEASHNSYNKKLDFEWLCRSCHVKKDKKNHHNATYPVIIKRYEDFTGNKAIKEGE